MARDIVVVGTSTGGVQALRHLLTRIPPSFPGTVLAVVHRSPYHIDGLASVIAGASAHQVHEPRDGETIRRGRVYLAPRDRHLVVQDDSLRLVRGPKEHFTRPAVDPLFRSAAAAYGPRVAGVLLTGAGHDGVSGLIAIKAAGGFVIVQTPEEAQARSMPVHAIVDDSPDAVLALDEIAATITALMNGRPVPATGR